MSNLQKIIRLLGERPSRPEFQVPSLTLPVYSAFDIATLASASLQHTATGEISTWHLMIHRSGARVLTRKCDGESVDLVAVPAEGLPRAKDNVFRGCVEICDTPGFLSGDVLAEVFLRWSALNPEQLNTRKERLHQAELLVTRAATAFALKDDRMAGSKFEKAIEEFLLMLDSAPTARWQVAPRSVLIAHLLECLSAEKQDGLADVMAMGPVDVVRALPFETLETLSECLQITASLSEEDVLQFTPADMIYHSLEPVRPFVQQQLAQQSLPVQDFFSKNHLLRLSRTYTT